MSTLILTRPPDAILHSITHEAWFSYESSARVDVVEPAASAADAGHPVARHPLQDWPEAVGPISYAIDASLPVATPLRHLIERLKLVDVLALGIVGLAEYALADHLIDDLVRSRVAVVLGHHVDCRTPLAGLHNPAAFLDRDSRRDLAQHVDPALQRGDRLSYVIRYRSPDQNRFEVRALQHLGVVRERLGCAEAAGDLL